MIAFASSLYVKDPQSKLWAGRRAARFVLGEIRVRSAMQHKAARDHAAALIDLEYVRDHFDCGVPCLHQMIWLYAGEDESVRRNVAERLRDLGRNLKSPHHAARVNGRQTHSPVC
jgi:hypothetical protein